MIGRCSVLAMLLVNGWSCSQANTPSGGLGSLVVLAAGQIGPQDLVVDATNVYWTNSDGTVMTFRSMGAHR